MTDILVVDDERDIRELLLVGRIDRIEILARFGRDERAIDKQVVTALQLGLGGFRRWIEFPEISENELRGRTAGARRNTRGFFSS